MRTQMHNDNSMEMAGSVVGFISYIASHFINLNILQIHSYSLVDELTIDTIRAMFSIAVPIIAYFCIYWIKKNVTKES